MSVDRSALDVVFYTSITTLNVLIVIAIYIYIFIYFKKWSGKSRAALKKKKQKKPKKTISLLFILHVFENTFLRQHPLEAELGWHLSPLRSALISQSACALKPEGSKVCNCQAHSRPRLDKYIFQASSARTVTVVSFCETLSGSLYSLLNKVPVPRGDDE